MNLKQILIKLLIVTATLIWIIGAMTTAWFEPSGQEGVDALVRLVTAFVGLIIGIHFWFYLIFKRGVRE